MLKILKQNMIKFDNFPPVNFMAGEKLVYKYFRQLITYKWLYCTHI